MSQAKPRETRSYGLNDPTNHVVEEWPKSKRDLYEAARTLFWEKGFGEASVQDIVSAAGLTKGAFYHYFGAKDDLLEIMFDRSLVRLMRALELQHGQDLTVVETLHGLIREMVFVVREYRIEVALFWELYRRQPRALSKSNADRRRRFYRSITELAQRGIDNGELDAQLNPQIFAMALIGICQHSQHWFVPGRGVTLDELASSIGRLILEGAVRRG